MADRCYVLRFHAMPADELRGSVDEVGAAQLGDRLVGHLAHANPHWRSIRDGSPGLAVVQTPT